MKYLQVNNLVLVKCLAMVLMVVSVAFPLSRCDSIKDILISRYDSILPSEAKASMYKPMDSTLSVLWEKRKLSEMADSLEVYRKYDSTKHYDDLLFELSLILEKFGKADSLVDIIGTDSSGWDKLTIFRLRAWDLEEIINAGYVKLKAGTSLFPKGTFQQQRMLAFYELFLNYKTMGINRLKEAYGENRDDDRFSVFSNYIKSVNSGSNGAAYVYIATSDGSIYNPHYSAVRGAGLGFNIGGNSLSGVWRIGFIHHTLEKAVSIKRNDTVKTSCKSFASFGMEFGTDVEVVQWKSNRFSLYGSAGFLINIYATKDNDRNLKEESHINGIYAIGPVYSYSTLAGRFLSVELLYKYLPSNIKHYYPTFERKLVLLQICYGLGGQRN